MGPRTALSEGRANPRYRQIPTTFRGFCCYCGQVRAPSWQALRAGSAALDKLAARVHASQNMPLGRPPAGPEKRREAGASSSASERWHSRCALECSASSPACLPTFTQAARRVPT